jgi:predicted DCC family thiol-disulfide oxidoreductase YuxK
VTVYFDGRCPLCRREIAHYRRRDRAGRVRWVDLHRAGPELEALGVAPQAALQRLHVLDRARRLHTGVAAFAVVWDQLPGYRWLSRAVRIPGLIPLLERGYGLVTRWRLRGRCGEGTCG